MFHCVSTVHYRGLMLLCLMIVGFVPITLMAHPASCRPSPGATKDCVARVPTPYIYDQNTCGSHPDLISEAAALQWHIDHSWSTRCDVTPERTGWLTAQRVVHFCGVTSTWPRYSYGLEIGNVSNYIFHYKDCDDGEQHEYDNDAVIRNRTLVCPLGYIGNGEYCEFQAASDPDVNKNAGKQCPTCGNPISPGVGNKFQEETDYTGAGASPLTFARYYNSILANATFSSVWMSSYTFRGKFGGAAVAQLASAEDEPRYQAIELDRIGANWRHTYQRAVVLVGTTNFQQALAYRPDGRVLAFSFYNGAYIPSPDVSDRLEQLVDGTWKYTTAAADEIELFNAAGKLQSIQERTGRSTQLTYDSCNRLNAVTDNFGRSLTFGYNIPCGGANSAYRITSVTNPAGGVLQYGYDAEGRLTSVVHPGGGTRTYHYEDTANPLGLTGITDESNSRYATWTYDGSSRAASSKHGTNIDNVTVGYTKSCSFCNPYEISKATVTDALGAVRTYNYGGKFGVKLVTSIVQPAASGTGTRTSSFTYDANGNLATETDFNGRQTRYTYDLTRNLRISQTDAYGTPRARTITTQWHSTFRLPTQIDEPGKQTTFTYDTSGNLLTKTELDPATSESRTWTNTYNTFGQLLTADGPRTDVSDVTTYAYYACSTGYQCGQLQTITNALGQVTTYNTYNGHGQPLIVTDPNGVITTLTYDLRQRLTSRTVGSEQTTFEYWPTGLLKKATLPDGSYLSYSYDAAHRLTGISDAAGNQIAYTLDAMGNRTVEEQFDPASTLRETRTRVFNILNRLTQEIGAAGTPAVTTSYVYDNNGNQTNINAPLNRNTVQAFDELNRLTTVTDPASGVTSYGYNALDQLISVTDPRTLATTYAYNSLGDLKQQISPDTGTTTNTYDSGGNLKTSTNARGIITTYTYDALNRMKSAAFKLGTTTDQTITYNYDASTNGKGHLTSASDASHSMAWTYDAQGRVTGKSQVVGAVTHSVGYGYLNGQLTAVTTPSGQTITYGYTNNQITSIKVNGAFLISTVVYDPFGPPTQWTWGNGTQSSRTYDQDGNVMQVTGPVTTTYGYDDAFRITGITDTTNSALSWLYGYDNLDRLTSASKTGTTIGYTYDANGNRLSQTGTSASTYTIAANSNQVTATSGALARTYGYNSDGNINSYTGISFQYNNRGRIKSSTKNSVTTNYTYNALGELVKKSTSMYVYDESGHLLGQYTTAGALTSEIVWLGDTPVATIRPASGGGVEVFYIHTDHLNAPRVVTQPSNNAQRWRWDSNPFGSPANDNPSGLGVFTLDLRFPGQIAMPESGLYQNYFRDYDYQTGRYVQSDPIGLAAGTNTYGYVGANPISFVDPTGLLPTDFPSERELQGARERDCARGAMLNNYNDMLRANWRFSDRYFHCKGNCEAARCGPSGFDEACSVGNFRELYGLFKGDPRADSRADEAANRAGREGAGNHPTQTCQVICAGFRPRGLPAQF